MFGLFHFRKNRKNEEANQPEEEDKAPSEARRPLFYRSFVGRS